MKKATDKTPKYLELMKICLKDYFNVDDDAFHKYIQKNCEYLDLFANDTLITEGEENDDVYFVLSGRLRAIKSHGEDDARVLGEIGRGETVGELALFMQEPRSATVIATRNSVVGKLSRETVEAALSKYPIVAMTITRQVITRFRKSEQATSAPTIPAAVAIVGLGHVDTKAFVEKLVKARKAHCEKVKVIQGEEVRRKFSELDQPDISQPRGDLSMFLGQQELINDTVFMVTDNDDFAWSKTAVHHADEIIIVADATGSSDLHEIEKLILEDDNAPPISRTLVLLHDKDLKNPSNTAAWLDKRLVHRHFHIRPELERDWRRLGRVLSGKAIGLVLSGGGARGYAHVGIIRALEDAGIEFDYVGGTSIGAIIATWVAMDIHGDDMVSQVRYTYLESPVGNVTGDFNFLPIVSLIKGRRAKWITTDMMTKHTTGDIDLEDSWKPIFMIASNYSRQREQVLQRGNFINNMLASFAIPGLFPPRFINRELMFDGGSFNNFPVDVMRQQGATRIIGIDLLSDHTKQFDLEETPSPFALFVDQFRKRKNRKYKLPAIPDTLLTASFVTSMNRQKEMRSMVDLLFKPDVRGISMLDWKKFDLVVERNRKLAEEKLGEMPREELEAWQE